MRTLSVLFMVAITATALRGAPQPTAVPSGMLSVEATPLHADIYVDRVNRAQTPAELQLPPGQHIVTLRAEGYKSEHRTIMIDDGGRTSLNVTLEKIAGILIAASDPPGAEVTIDGISYGTSPALITTLPLGSYKVSYALSGYKPKSVETSLKDRTPVKAYVSLVSDTATLKVESNVDGVSVMLNGVARGNAPCTVERIPAGDVDLEVREKGYRPYVQKFRLAEGETQSVKIELEVQPASLRVVSIPEKARVYIDNSFRGETPLAIDEIEVGAHRVRVEREGYDPNARNVELAAGEASVEEFRLASNTGSLMLTTEPDGVTVIIDGNESGKTIAAKDQGLGVSAPLQIDGLADGVHTIKLVKPGYFEKQSEVTVARGITTPVDLKLRRKFIPNYEVVTQQGAFKGVLVSITAEGTKIERSPGVERLFTKGEIISQRRLPDAAQ